MKRKYYKYRQPFSLRNFFSTIAEFFQNMSQKKKIIFTSVIAGGALIVVFLTVGDNLFANTFALESDSQQAQSEALPSSTPLAEPASEPTPAPTPEPTPDPTLKEGMESAEVQKLQQRLMDLGYLDIDETTQYYGPATNYAVSLFQRQHALPMDGVCGPQTLSLIYADTAKPYTLLEGTEGDDVRVLQDRLIELGFLGKSTGYYGSETIEAVKKFQARNELGVDGKTGEVTLALIYSPQALPSEEKAKEIARKGNIDTFISSAANQLGKPYVWGAQGPKSFDCSGLVTYCLREAGSTTGRYNAAGFSQNGSWDKITDIDNLQRGDLIFFYNNARSKIGHVGIYIGDGMMIDASSANGQVVKRSAKSDYWRSHFVCGRRPW